MTIYKDGRTKIVQTRLKNEDYDYLTKKSNEFGLHRSTLVYLILRIIRKQDLITDTDIMKEVRDEQQK